MKFGGFKKSSISAPDHVSTYKRGGGIFKVTKCNLERRIHALDIANCEHKN